MGTETHDLRIPPTFGLDDYRKSVETHGLKETWEAIVAHVQSCGETGFLNTGSFGDLYEMGLAIQDKDAKKKTGRYYTPPDVAAVMAEWLERLPGRAVCDVGCGTGNLMLAYLARLGRKRARELLSSGNVYVYETDSTALLICLLSVGLRYGADMPGYVTLLGVDFLSTMSGLPDDCKVISNPPYGKISRDIGHWDCNQVLEESGDMYAGFMAKIMERSKSSVMLTPCSFLGGEKFRTLREKMCDFGGFVVSFDNVPGTIFSGRKHGVFNSNRSNSVRAAITVVDGSVKEPGFRTSHLIRFSNAERGRLMTSAALESFLGTRMQNPTECGRPFVKCHRSLEDVYGKWMAASDGTLADMWHVGPTSRAMYVPSTCRYRTVASVEPLARSGQHKVEIRSDSEFWYAFCLMNSSFAYWHWRLYDGCVTYPKGLLKTLPTFFGCLDSEGVEFCRDFGMRLVKERDRWLKYKNNKGVCENVKYPVEYRDRLDSFFLKAIGCESSPRVFDVIHANHCFDVGRIPEELMW